MGHPSWLARLGLYLVVVLLGLQFLASLMEQVFSDGRAFLTLVVVSVVCYFIVHRGQATGGHRGPLERTPHDPSPRGGPYSTQGDS